MAIKCTFKFSLIRFTCEFIALRYVTRVKPFVHSNVYFHVCGVRVSHCFFCFVLVSNWSFLIRSTITELLLSTMRRPTIALIYTRMTAPDQIIANCNNVVVQSIFFYFLLCGRFHCFFFGFIF